MTTYVCRKDCGGIDVIGRADLQTKHLIILVSAKNTHNQSKYQHLFQNVFTNDVKEKH